MKTHLQIKSESLRGAKIRAFHRKREQCLVAEALARDPQFRLEAAEIRRRKLAGEWEARAVAAAERYAARLRAEALARRGLGAAAAPDATDAPGTPKKA